MSAHQSKDRVVRAMTSDGQFRVIVATMAETCSEAARRQKVPASLAERQAQLLCAGVLIRETMQPNNRVQIIIRDSLGHRLVADCLPDGKNRSIVNPGSDDQELRRDGLLQVNYTLRNGDLHQGIVSLEEDATMSDAMMRYLQESEQITAMVCIESSGNAVGGFVVQITPEAKHAGLAAMTAHLETFGTLQSWLTDSPSPTDLIDRLLQGHEYALLSDAPLCFGCTCSEERMLLGLSTLSNQEIAELLGDGEAIEVHCEACGQSYSIPTDALAKLLILPTTDKDTPPN